MTGRDVKCVRHPLKILFLAALFAWGSSRSAEGGIAVFPFEDLTMGVAGINMEVTEHTVELLNEMGYRVAPPDAVVAFLARHRVRWTGWVDRITARKAGEELGATYILLGTVMEVDPDRMAFGICARVVRVSDYQVVWGRTAALSEVRTVTLLGLGKLHWPKVEATVLKELFETFPEDMARRRTVRPDIGVLQMFLRPRHARGSREITCGVRVDISGPPPTFIGFQPGKGKMVPAVKKGVYYTGTWRAPATEGSYPVHLVARWTTPSRVEKKIFLASFYVDNHPPSFTLKVSHGRHLPAGFAFRRYVRMVPVLEAGEPVSRWRLEISSIEEEGVVVREEREGSLPGAFTWRGTDGTGYALPNGPYIVRVTLWDLAGNIARAEKRLLLVRQLPKVTVEAVAEKETLDVVVTVGKHLIPVTDWRFEIWDNEGNLLVQREGEGTPEMIKAPNRKGLRYTLELRDDFGNRLVLRNRKLRIVKAGVYTGKTKKLKRWINEF